MGRKVDGGAGGVCPCSVVFVLAESRMGRISRKARSWKLVGWVHGGNPAGGAWARVDGPTLSAGPAAELGLSEAWSVPRRPATARGIRGVFW